MNTLREGSTLRQGTYRIERVLGQGGFGITYLAMDLSLDRLVAIKEFFPKDFCDRDATTSHVTLGTSNTEQLVNKLKTKFIKEAKNIAKLDYPGIIRIYAAFEENNTAYYVMEFIEGESLADMVKRSGAIPEARALRYITEVGKALEYVHAHKINHLDVKPGNILVRRSDDKPVLIDFGLSKQYDGEGEQTSTMAPGFTHGYAPIEQYKPGGVSTFTPQTDIYALAATLYYILSGVKPPHATFLVEEELTFPSQISPRLVRVISKAMSTRRTGRHESIRAFLADLDTQDREERTVIVAEKQENVNQSIGPDSVDRITANTDVEHEDKGKNKIPGFVWPLIFIGFLVLLIIGISNMNNNAGSDYDDFADSDSVLVAEEVIYDSVAVEPAEDTLGQWMNDLPDPEGEEWEPK